jgi:uncharacterized protein (DUF4213/DUF364 family)
MLVTQHLKQQLNRKAQKHTIKEVRIGLGYTAVRLDSGKVGLAYTFREHAGSSCNVFQGQLPLAGKRGDLLLNYLGSANLIESGVGLATANALMDPLTDTVPLDILDYLALQPGDHVSMVGYFEPVVKKLENMDIYLRIFEKREHPAALPAEMALAEILHSDVIIISATTFVNHTIDALLQRVTDQQREVIILGASTPLSKSLLNDYPITLLSGIQIPQPETVLRIVSEGGGMQSLKHAVEKVNLRA